LSDQPEQPIGVQYLMDDPLSGTVVTSAWLGVAHHGEGIEEQMRGIALDLAVTCIGAEAVRSYVFQRNQTALSLARHFCYEDQETTAIRVVGTQLRAFDVLELSARHYRMRAPWATSSMAGWEELAGALPAPSVASLRTDGSALVRS
jgi:hypothetical protein